MNLLKLKNIDKDIKQIEAEDKSINSKVKKSKKVENFYTQVSNNLPLSTTSQSPRKLFQPFFQNEQDIYHSNESNEQEAFSVCKEIHSNLNIKQYVHSDQYPVKENISSEFKRQTYHSRKESKFFYANEFKQQKSLSEICFTKDSKTSPQLSQHKNISPPEKQQLPKFFHVNENFILSDHYLLSQDSNLPVSWKPVQPISKDNYDESLIIPSRNKTPLGSPSRREVKSTNIKNLSNIQYINDTFSMNNEIEKSPQSISKTSKIPLRGALIEESEHTKFARTNRKILDLEISNTSLLALNNTLEKQTRRQMSEIKALRKKIVPDNISITSSTTNSTSNSEENDSSQLFQNSNSSIIDFQKIVNDSLFFTKSLKKALKLTKHLINEGRHALENQKGIDIPIYLKVMKRSTNSEVLNYENAEIFENS
ncbi:hypothetical protein PNEG_00595 [Pneumocystis murina B123]|uniref:Uncharacterized protein n=1 Tax=Pneumocystis murina (strain B123) TaxID=1069680 RepID=M7NQJ1_PNEMU|nr:hypothetical protein PNEG_00595 [Pneumocystis murina B123]EMR10993.1 hypothetical protein PNEG_00595 [Pneumocystis murina B123]